MSTIKKCEVCGAELPESEFSKSYKKRCKKCVAAMTKAKRKKVPTLEDLYKIEKTTSVVAMIDLTEAVKDLAVQLGRYVDSLLAKLENGGIK